MIGRASRTASCETTGILKYFCNSCRAVVVVVVVVVAVLLLFAAAAHVEEVEEPRTPGLDRVNFLDTIRCWCFVVGCCCGCE